MKIKDNWTLEDILTLKNIKSLNLQKVKNYIQDFNSFDEFAEDFKRKKYENFFEKDSSDFSFQIERDEAKQQIDYCNNNHYKLITFWDALYPEMLKTILYPPIVLYVNGSLQGADSLIISIVGTRKCTVYGKIVTERFAEFFARNNLIVCSGLANGIDTIAHLSTANSRGITYAVIASGLDCIHSSTHEKNAEKIIDSGGAIITEHKCGTNAIPSYFPQRNRIISGLSKAVLVVESDEKGGALITARFAFDQERYLFAVPGNITSDKSRGCNMLIKKDMAIPALNPEIILEELGLNSLITESKTSAKMKKLVKVEDEIIYNEISFEPIQIDELVSRTNLDISELLVRLLDLEFKGYVRQLPGKFYIRTN